MSTYGDAVIVTFDDGYYDFLQDVVLIMGKYDISATVFVSTGNWEEKYKVYKMIRELFLISFAARRKQYEQQLLEWAGLTNVCL